MMRLSAVQMSALLEGLDWSRVQPRDVVRPSATTRALLAAHEPISL